MIYHVESFGCLTHNTQVAKEVDDCRLGMEFHSLLEAGTLKKQGHALDFTFIKKSQFI